MYRDAPLVGAPCYRHASAPMAAQCQRCERALCAPCIVYDISSPHCIDCARRTRRRRAIGAAAKIAGVIAAVVGGVVFLATRPPSFDYGVEHVHIVQLHNKVLTERCDKQATLDYDESLISAGDSRGALADANAYLAQCGEWYRLRWVTYSAHEHLGEHAAAVAEATRLIAHDPKDRDYPWWRGVAYEEMGKLDEAIADYRRTLALSPGIDRIPFNLSNVLERKGEYCAAREPILQFVEHHPGFAGHAAIQDRLQRLSVLGRCPAPTPATEPPPR